MNVFVRIYHTVASFHRTICLVFVGRTWASLTLSSNRDCVLVPIVKIVLQLTSCDGDNENVVRRFRVETGERSDKDEVRFSFFLL